MPNCTSDFPLFGRVGRRDLSAEFCGGAITSDAGMLLLRQADRRLGLIDSVASVIPDHRRDPRAAKHSVANLLRQRVFGIACGYEDLNDHNRLRRDAGVTAALGRIEDGASAATFSRFERHWDRDTAWAVHALLIDHFVASFDEAPDELILDFDATDDRVHGQQPGGGFHGYYRHYCFLPLYVFCGEPLLVSYLRPGLIDGAKHAGAILRLLVKRLRQSWPGVRIVFRGDSGFCRRKILHWCEHNAVDYIVGLARNKRLERMGAPAMARAVSDFDASGVKQRHFAELGYAAKTWKTTRRVIAKCEVTARGTNPRFVITNSPGDGQAIYDRLYCARGEMENRIKEQQLGLFADRTSSTQWWANQCRLLLSSLAYVLLHTVRRIGLAGTDMARAQVSTIRNRLLKIGGIVISNTRRIRFLLPTHCPDQVIWQRAAEALKPSG